jgi:hypothetical protein
MAKVQSHYLKSLGIGELNSNNFCED